MTSTMEQYQGKQAANYCTLPTVDVEIVHTPMHCNTCYGELRTTDRLPFREHVGEACSTNHTMNRPKCAYCGDDMQTEHRQHPHHDAIECGRCGGVTGFALGD